MKTGLRQAHKYKRQKPCRSRTQRIEQPGDHRPQVRPSPALLGYHFFARLTDLNLPNRKTYMKLFDLIKTLLVEMLDIEEHSAEENDGQREEESRTNQRDSSRHSNRSGDGSRGGRLIQHLLSLSNIINTVFPVFERSVV